MDECLLIAGPSVRRDISVLRQVAGKKIVQVIGEFIRARDHGASSPGDRSYGQNDGRLRRAAVGSMLNRFWYRRSGCGPYKWPGAEVWRRRPLARDTSS